MALRDSSAGVMTAGNDRAPAASDSGIRAAIDRGWDDDATDPAMSMPGDFWSDLAAPTLQMAAQPEASDVIHPLPNVDVDADVDDPAFAKTDPGQTVTAAAPALAGHWSSDTQADDPSPAVLPIFEDGNSALVWLTQRKVIARISAEIEERPDDPSLYLDRSAAWVALGSPREAIEDCARALGIKPDFARAYVARAAICFDLGAHQECLADCNRALRIDRARTDALRQRALAHAGLEQHASAIDDYDEAILLSPSSAALFKDRGEMKGRLGDFAGALEDLNVAVAMSPADDDALFRRNVVRALISDGPAADWGKATQRVLADLANRPAPRDAGRIA